MPKNIVILTGAGISAESGLATFRAEDGLWENHPVEEVATPEGFARNPALVHEFYNARRAAGAAAQPNPAHRALGRLEAELDGLVTVVTQNIDDLHERGGSKNVIHMHGEAGSALCANCGHRWPAPAVMQPSDACPHCGRQATRPDIVWFGEMPYRMEEIWGLIREADIFASIGTSGNVYPAAGFVQDARRAGVETVELNLVPSANAHVFDRQIIGKAGEVVPRWVEEMLRL